MHSIAQTEIADRDDVWLLLDEIEHRVANEYAMAISSLQILARAADANTRQILEAAAKRLHDHSQAHRALCQPITSGEIDLYAHLQVVCRSLSKAMLEEQNIRLILTGSSIAIDARKAWRIGLVVSELIMNARRHAFPRGDGEICVSINQIDRAVICHVSDNGKCCIPHVAGRGSRILDGIARGLDGSMMRDFSPSGASTTLEVPMSDGVVGSCLRVSKLPIKRSGTST